MAGPSVDLYNYLKSKGYQAAFIEQPHPDSESHIPTLEEVKDQKIIKKIKLPLFWFPLRRAVSGDTVQRNFLLYLLFKFKDAVSVFYFMSKLKGKYDFFIGIESLNAILGIFFRRIGKVKKVVYDVIDYSPRRYENKLMNRIFHAMDRFCCLHCDYTWSQTQKIIDKRFKLGLPRERGAMHLVKQTGIEREKIKQLPLDEIQRYQLVYVGHVFKVDGVELIIEAMPEILKRVPQANLIIMGDGDLKVSLERKCRQLDIDKQVEFTGIIGDMKEVEQYLLKSAVALTLYRFDNLSVKYYNDPSKPKLYLGCGLPQIITKTVPISKLIKEKEAGLAIDYTKEALIKAALKFLEDDNLFKRYRLNAMHLAGQYSWNGIFSNLFEKMGLKP